jgi:hypothetical protein
LPHFETPPPSDGAAAFDWTIFGVVVAIIFGIVTIVVTVLVTRRFGNRRAVLTWFSEATPLIPSLAEASHLEVTYRDIPVRNPVLVTVVLFNSGPLDITSEMFDSGRPIRVDVGGEFYGITRVEGEAEVVIPEIGAKGEQSAVLIQPRLLKRRQSWSFSAVVSGATEVKIDLPLANTDERKIVPLNWGDTIWSAFGEAFVDLGGPLAQLASQFVPRRGK